MEDGSRRGLVPPSDRPLEYLPPHLALEFPPLVPVLVSPGFFDLGDHLRGKRCAHPLGFCGKGRDHLFGPVHMRLDLRNRDVSADDSGHNLLQHTPCLDFSVEGGFELFFERFCHGSFEDNLSLEI